MGDGPERELNTRTRQAREGNTIVSRKDARISKESRAEKKSGSKMEVKRFFENLGKGFSNATFFT